MKKFITLLHLVAFVAVAAPTLLAATETLYTGTCRNVTCGQDGLLKLYVADSERGLKGYMSISGFLVGSGPLKGSREGHQFKFHTSDQAWGLEIDWQGTLQEGKLSGEYFVAPNARMGTPRQVGEWQVTEFTGTHGIDAAEAAFYIWSTSRTNQGGVDIGYCIGFQLQVTSTRYV